MSDVDEITAEMARLLDESSGLRPQPNDEREPERRLPKDA
jgi:hypothetical protein